MQSQDSRNSSNDSDNGHSSVTSAPLRVGLTGGIASGKSAVAERFAALGVPVIDTDVVAREVVAPGQPALAEIAGQFGPAVLRDDGSLDRGAMRKLVFSDDDRRRQLEAILHPRIRTETFRQAQAAGGDYQVIVVPLLAESPMRHSMDRILVVDVPESVQAERLMARDGSDAAEARRIIAAQASRSERLAIASEVISNTGTLDELDEAVSGLHTQYLALARERRT